MKKRLIFFWMTVLISFSVNLLPSLKYPDSELNLVHFFFSGVVLFAIFLLMRKQLKMVLFLSGMAGIIIFCINFRMLSEARLHSTILDVLLSVEYPLYVVFITPLFGFNYIFSSRYEQFALGIAIISGVLLLLLVLLSRGKRT